MTFAISYCHVTAEIKVSFFLGFLASAAHLKPAYAMTIAISYSHVTAEIKVSFFLDFPATAGHLQPAYAMSATLV